MSDIRVILPRAKHMDRRTVLLGSAAGALGTSYAGIRVGNDTSRTESPGVVQVTTGTETGPARSLAAAADFLAFRARYRMMQIGGSGHNPAVLPFSTILDAIEADANGHWSTLNKSPTRTNLWTNGDANATPDVNTRVCVNRLRTMAIAYKSSGSALQGNTALLADITDALQWIATNRYYSGATPTGNWYNWQIGIPLGVLDTVVILFDDLPISIVTALMDAVNYFTPNPTLTAANRMWQIHIVLLRAIVVESTSKFDIARTALIDLIHNVPDGDGFYDDGSFVQHSEYSYTGSYGMEMLYRMAGAIFLLHGSGEALTNAEWALARTWVYKAFEPLIYKGAMMDMTRGRGMSRWNAPDHMVGHVVVWAVTLMAQVAPSADAAAFESMVKYWVNADTARSLYFWDPNTPVHKVSMYIAWLAHSIATSSMVATRGEIVGNYQFPGMDRISHKTPNYTLAIAMYSNRIKNFEAINTENKHGWYTGTGMTYLYNDDIDHYQDDFWPTVDPYRLPGTTVDKRTRGDGATAGSNGSAVVGGAVIGVSGVACMKMSLDGGQLTALKSWFCLGDRVVMVGSGITGTTANVVETIIENRNIGASGTNLVRMNSTSTNVLTNIGVQETLAANWLHVEGVGGIVPIGSNPPIKGIRAARTGRWSDINGSAGTPTDMRTRRYITLWFDHGTTPTDGGYAYGLFPSYTAATTGSYAAAPTIDVPIRNSNVHYLTAQISTTQIRSAVFWTNAANTAGVFTCNAIAAVMLRVPASGPIEIALSDPTQSRTSAITLTVQVLNSSVVSSDPATSVTRTASSVTITYNPTGAKGRTAKIVLSS